MKKWRLLNELEDGTDLSGVVVEDTPKEEPKEEIKEDDKEEIVITIGDEEPPEVEKAPEWVRELRKRDKEKTKRLRELEDELKKLKPQAPALGKKPTLDDFDYDADKFEQALTSWYDRKRKVDEDAKRAQELEKEQEISWKKRLETYAELRSSLKVQDYEDAETLVQEMLNTTQQGILVKGAKNPAIVVYALGKNPKKIKEIAEITDPINFAFAIADLENQLKVTNKKAPPAPEKVISGSGVSSSSLDNKLEELRAEAQKTGNYSKVIAYKQKLKQKD